MASNPLPYNGTERPAPELTDKEWWDLLAVAREATTKQLEAVGGAEAWMQYLRYGDEDPEDLT